MDKTALQIIIERELIDQLEPEIKLKTKPKVKQTTQRRRVRCINNGKEFISISQAAEYANLYSASNLSKHLRGIQYPNGIGRHPQTDELLKWEYVNDI